MKSVRFHFEAEQELLEHEAWYRQRSEVAAQGFLRPFVNRPSAGQSVAMANIATYSLAIHITLLYRIRGDEVFVTAIAHQSRRPGYWHHRK